MAICLMLALVVLLIPACEKRREGQEPADINWDDDNCEHCGMVISDKLYAAQVVEPNGDVHRFDDVGDLIIWLENQPWKAQGKVWVADARDGTWIDAEKAYWSPGHKTPMGFGFGASAQPFERNIAFAMITRITLMRDSLSRRRSGQAGQGTLSGQAATGGPADQPAVNSAAGDGGQSQQVKRSLKRQRKEQSKRRLRTERRKRREGRQQEIVRRRAEKIDSSDTSQQIELQREQQRRLKSLRGVLERARSRRQSTDAQMNPPAPDTQR